MPEAHRREVRQARIRVAATLDDCHVAVLVEALESGERWVEAPVLGDCDRIALLDRNAGPHPVVLVIAVGHHGIESIVAAGEFDNHQCALRMPLAVGVQCFGCQRA